MNTQRIDELVKAAVADSKIPGIVAYVTNEQEILYQGAFGHRNIETREHMTTDTVFWIASMTKAVTSIAAMQLVEQGKLHLDQPLSRILPDLESIQVLEGIDNNGQPILREPKTAITLRHLLTHTAGFTYDFFDPNTIKYIEAKKLPGIIECKNDALKTALVSDPGERWVYGISTDWVGKAIEAASNKDLRSYFKEHILLPLEMVDTDFIISPDARKRLATIHQRSDQSLSPVPFEIPQEPEFFMGGGGLYSTAEDYTKLLQMLVNEGLYKGNRILYPETIQEMSKNQIGDMNVPPMKSAIAALTNDVEFFPEMEKKWGLGFLITTEDAPTGRSAGSLSWAGLANTYYWIDPIKRITAVVCTQVLPFADANVLEFLHQFESSIYEQIAAPVVEGS